jgi:hypothetical protein
MTPSHRARAQFLRDLAVLIGCSAALEVQLPDGCQPDVFATNPRRDLLFLGEAKHSESPSNRAACYRLARYVGWAGAFARRAAGRAMVAVCHGSASDPWGAVLHEIAEDGGLPGAAVYRTPFSAELTLVWLVVGSRRPAAGPVLSDLDDEADTVARLA